MKIQNRRIDTIRPYERNPRRNDPAVDAVANSLREFGFRQAIVVDAQGVIVTGHTTYKAARKLGLTSVPVHVAEDLTPEQIRGYRLADNKSAELAEWDDAKLTQEILALADAGLDLKQFGFPQLYATNCEAVVSSATTGDAPTAGVAILRCTFTTRQHEIVQKALAKAIKAGPFGPTGNSNTAGNALARICEATQ